MDFSDEDAKKAIAQQTPQQFEYITSPTEQLFAREFAVTGSLLGSHLLAFPDQLAREGSRLTSQQRRARAASLIATNRVNEIYLFYKQAVNARMDIRSDRILQELACVAFSDVADAYEADGLTLKNIHQIPKHLRASISKFKAGVTGDGMFTEVTMIDKMKALQLLSNIKNMDQANKAAKAPKVIIELPKEGTTYE